MSYRVPPYYGPPYRTGLSAPADQQQPLSPQDRQRILNGVYVKTGKVIKTVSLIGAIVFTLLAILLFALGWYLLSRKTRYSGKVLATIQDGGRCTPIVTGLYPRYNCQLNVKYVINGGTITSPLTIQSTQDLTKGGAITISYDPANPIDIQPGSTISWTWAGWLLIIIAVLVVLFAWIGYWLISRIDIPTTTSQMAELWGVFK